MKNGLLCLIVLQAAVVNASDSAQADTFTSCSSRRGFSYSGESGDSGDSPFLILQSADKKKIFYVQEIANLTATQVIGPIDAIRGIQVGKTTFDWIDSIEKTYQHLSVNYGPNSDGKTAHVSVDSGLTDACP